MTLVANGEELATRVETGAERLVLVGVDVAVSAIGAVFGLVLWKKVGKTALPIAVMNPTITPTIGSVKPLCGLHILFSRRFSCNSAVRVQKRPHKTGRQTPFGAYP